MKEEDQQAANRLVEVFAHKGTQLIVAPDINGQLLVMEQAGGEIAKVYRIADLVRNADALINARVIEEARDKIKEELKKEFQITIEKLNDFYQTRVMKSNWWQR